MGGSTVEETPRGEGVPPGVLDVALSHGTDMGICEDGGEGEGLVRGSLSCGRVSLGQHRHRRVYVAVPAVRG